MWPSSARLPTIHISVVEWRTLTEGSSCIYVWTLRTHRLKRQVTKSLNDQAGLKRPTLNLGSTYFPQIYDDRRLNSVKGCWFVYVRLYARVLVFVIKQTIWLGTTYMHAVHWLGATFRVSNNPTSTLHTIMAKSCCAEKEGCKWDLLVGRRTSERNLSWPPLKDL